MFGQLRNKLSGFVDKLIGRKEEETPKLDKKEEAVEAREIKKIEEKEIEPSPEKEEIATYFEQEKENISEFEKEKEIEIATAHKIEEKKEQTRIEKKKETHVHNARQRKPHEHKPVEIETEVHVEIEPQEVRTEIEDKIQKVEIERKMHVEIEQKKQAEIELKKQVEIERKKPADIEPEKIQEKTIQTAAQEKQVEQKKTFFDIAKGIFKKKEEQKPAFENVTRSTKPKKEERADVEFAKPLKPLGQSEIERLEKTSLEGKRDSGVKIGLGKNIGGLFTPTITVEKKDINDLLDELELSLIEADVGLEVTQEVKERLEKRLVGLKVERAKMQNQVNEEIKQVLVEIMTVPQAVDFDKMVEEAKKPVKLLFVGPNGAGKTTTIAKIAKRFQEQGKTVCIAAGDTFRAAAIEQLTVHAQRLNVPIIKSKYGADPASVAFDAIKHARVNNIDVVLIDSAGRQDTNTNLIDEMKKIQRVIVPDLKIYVGESIGGSALIEQIRTFNEAIGIDGAILTKLDCDAKGGTAVSLTYSTRVPIMFLGTGQNYSDLKVFDAKETVEQIME